jgi:trehalose 6-phosphate synthase/phosphatase
LWEANESVKKEIQFWNDYVQVNRIFANKILQHHNPGDIIWIHDYHLLLVPSMIRESIPDAIIGFFLHTPFPSSEIFRCLPKRKQILEGVLASNLIGFQTYSYARHFISSCTRVLGLESSPTGVEYAGNIVKIAIFPIGIDVEKVEQKRDSKLVQEKMEAIKDMYPNMKIIVGRDKLDHVKGVQHKLNAFEKFLTIYPEYQNRIVLIQVTSPPLNREIAKLESKINELVSRINGNFGSLEYAPVHHYHQHLDQEDYFALLKSADVGLITSVRDGMNTTSHEYIVCQKDNCGPLILSEFTGIAGSFSAAIMVNPFDYNGVANAIHDALNLTKEEKIVKHQLLYDHVTKHNAEFWAKSFLKGLKSTTNQFEYITSMSNTPMLNFNEVYSKYSESKCRLLLFDYDGTLTPIRKTPGAAIPQPEMMRALIKLVEDPNNHVYVISGRDQVFLQKWLGNIKVLGLSAEHGCFIKYPNNEIEENSSSSSLAEEEWINLSEDIDLSWKTDVTEIFTYYTERTQGSFIEHKRASLTWHYRLADPSFGSFQAKECQNEIFLKRLIC